jgi:nucleoside-diphosphate-sugar epimerase
MSELSYIIGCWIAAESSFGTGGSNAMGRHAFIVGGTGQIGRAVASNLLKCGWDVELSHRGRHPAPAELIEQGVKIATLDRNEPAALAAAIGSGADAVIDTVAFTSEHAGQLVELSENVGAFVVISSASVYRDAAGRTLDEARTNGFPELPVPIPESQPTVSAGPGTYSTRKIALENKLLDDARCPVTVLRPCAISGPGSLHPREWWFVKRLLDGRMAIPLAYRGASRFHTSSVANIAELVRVTLDNPGSRVLNAADPVAITVKEIGVHIARYFGQCCEFVDVPDTGYPPTVGATPWSVPRPFVLDTCAAADLGYMPVTTYADSAGATCGWLAEVSAKGHWRELFPVLANYPRELFDYAAEDRSLERLRVVGL